MRYLGIDYGQKRIGLALSSVDEEVVTPYKTLKNSSRQKAITEVINIVKQEKIEAIVVGLPIGLQGEETLTTRQVRNFVADLRKKVSIPIYLMDESYSSYEAESKLRELGMSSKKIKKIVDQVAAQDILITYLRSRTHD